MLLLGIDIETGGSFAETDLSKNFITEIGAVLWDTDLSAPVEFFSCFIKSKHKISEEAVEYTGITDDMLSKYGIHIFEAFDKLGPLLGRANMIVAQNGINFDKPILLGAAKFVDKEHKDGPFSTEFFFTEMLRSITWIDTLYDVDFPRNCKSRNLTYLNGFHGFCNPFPHRAVFDVVSMFKILSQYDLNKIIESAKSPLIEVEWKRRYPREGTTEFKEFTTQKDYCSSKGFRWKPEEKRWVLITKERSIPTDLKQVLGEYCYIKEYKQHG